LKKCENDALLATPVLVHNLEVVQNLILLPPTELTKVMLVNKMGLESNDALHLFLKRRERKLEFYVKKEPSIILI
jgi:hypothetical protein